jgi:hypothetical protein
MVFSAQDIGECYMVTTEELEVRELEEKVRAFNMQKFQTKDSGKREAFSTGSVRDSRDGKGRFDLISPIGLKRLAQLYERGAVKYGERNWEKGQKLGRYLDSALRHLNDYRSGERTEDHLAAVAWNAFSFIHTEQLIREGRLPKELDDIGATSDLTFSGQPENKDEPVGRAPVWPVVNGGLT